MFSRIFNFNKKKSPEPQINEPLPSHVEKWTQQHVVAWLKKNDLTEYASTFLENAISGQELIELSESDLETSLNIKKLGPRKKLIKLIQDQIALHNSSSSLKDNNGSPVPRKSKNSPIGTPKLPSEHETGDEDSQCSSSNAGSDMILVPNTLTSLPDHLTEKYALFEEMPHSTIVINTDKTILYTNKSVERLFLYKREELLGCNIKVLMAEPHRSKHDSYVDKYLETGKASIMGRGRMVEGKAKDNSLVPVWLSITESADDQGNKIFIGTFKDLRSINPSSHSVASKMLALLDNLVDTAVVINVKSEIIFFNKSAEVLFGYGRDEVLGKTVELLMPAEVAKVHSTFIDNYMKTKQGKVIGKGRNVEILKKNGARQLVFFSLTETKWAEGNSTAFCATLQPATELLNAKKDLSSNGAAAVKKVEEKPLLDSNDPTTRMLLEVIDNPLAHHSFKQFLTQAKNVEPLLFIEHVDQFMVLKSNFYRYNAARAIYEMFIRHGASKEVNLPSSVKQELLSQFVEKKVTQNSCSSNIFGAAYDVLISDMKNDVFARFMASAEFKNMQNGNEAMFSQKL